MSWQSPRAGRSLETDTANTLSAYQAGLRAAEARDRLEVNLDTELSTARRFNAKRLRNVVLLWTLVALAIAGVAIWFLDRVSGAEIVAVSTAILIFTPLARIWRTSDTDPAP